MVLVGQALRSAAMIHASTNFSHTVAFQKRDTHRLVTDGVYRSVFFVYPAHVYLPPSTTLQMVSPSIVCWILLLGAWYSTGASKPANFCYIHDIAVEILLLPHTRSAPWSILILYITKSCVLNN